MNFFVDVHISVACVLANFDAIWSSGSSSVKKTKVRMMFCYIWRHHLAFDCLFFTGQNTKAFHLKFCMCHLGMTMSTYNFFSNFLALAKCTFDTQVHVHPRAKGNIPLNVCIFLFSYSFYILTTYSFLTQFSFLHFVESQEPMDPIISILESMEIKPH